MFKVLSERCTGYVATPDRTDDYFLDAVRIESDNKEEGTVIFLDTA